jgi:hypothetical protein
MTDFTCLSCEKEKMIDNCLKRLYCKKCKSFLEFDVNNKICLYDYDHLINGKKYLVMSFQERSVLIYYRNEKIIEVDFQEINNQQDLENLVPRLLKLQVFS